MNRLKNGAVMVIALMMLLSSSAFAQVMQQVPPSALMVVKVNNLKAVNAKIGKLAQDLGLAGLAPPAADPLSFLQVQLKMQQGVNLDGELAFVMLDPATVPGATGPEDALVILAPVSDYQAFLGNFPGAQTEGGVSEVRLGADGGEPGFIASWGNYAAIAPGRAVVAAKPAGGLTSPAVTSKQLADRDIILYANFVALRGKLMPELQGARIQALSSVEAMLAQQPQMIKFTAVAKSLVSQMLNVAETYLKEADAATVGLSFVPEGINATVTTEFSPGSYLGKTFGAMKGTQGSMLTGLPAGKYLLYGGSVGDPAATSQLLNDLVDPILAELLAVGPEWSVAKEYADALKQYVNATRTSAFGIVAPTGAVGTESLIQMVNIQGGDAAAMKDANTRMVTAQNKLMGMLNLPGTAGMLPAHTPNAKTVDGVVMDSLVTKIEMNPQDAQAMQQAQVMSIIYGPQGAQVFYGTLNDKMLLFMGAKDATISSTITAVKQNSAELEVDTNLKAVAMQLPQQRLGVVYINAGEIATTSLSYARQFGLALPVMLPPDLPPIGVAVGTEGTAIRIDAHIPTITVSSFIAAGMQAQMQMQGGGAPPPGGGL